MEELVKKAKEASEAYYNETPIMSDHEYDQLVDQIRKLETKEGLVLKDSPTRRVGAKPVEKLPKFHHPYIAKSLDKTKDADLLIQKFREGIIASGDDNEDIVVMYKEDGSTGQAYYNHGRLQQLVTRGNGEVGNVVTHNAEAIHGLPIKIDYPGELVVRGEVLMSYEEFNRINDTIPEKANKYMNPRNLASATLTMLDPKEAAQRELHFKAFNLVHIGRVGDANMFKEYLNNSFYMRLKFLESQGFDIVDCDRAPIDLLRAIMDAFTEAVPNYPYPVDGLVMAMDNYKYASTLEGTEHHPHIMNGYALKWADEVVATTLRKIEMSPSRTGLLNPVAIFDPVIIDGTTVQRASLHNMSIIKAMKLHVGDTVTVYKSNMIIPQIDENMSADEHEEYTDEELLEITGCCPTCGHRVALNRSSEGILTAICPNEDCPEKLIGKLTHFCSRDCMDIQGLSEETISKLVELGFIKEYSDLFSLHEKPGIAFLPGFGRKRWSNMCDAARQAMNTDFVRFITALGITNIGKGQAKALYKYISLHYDELTSKFMDYGTYQPEMLFRHMALKHYDFSVIDGFGKITSDEIIAWALDHWQVDSPEARVMGLMHFTDKRPSTESASSSISGKAFCITGKLISFKNRDELVSMIESLGGKFVSSVSSKTDYLINNDTTSTSGKNKKAKEIGVPIISEEDFIKMTQ